MDNRPIGVFDSGIGGLTVVREILRVLPREQIIYIGDTARVPWGTRGRETIISFSEQLAHFLVKKKVKVIVVACHTASSIALPSLKKKIKLPLVGVIAPAVKEAIRKSKNRRIGIIGTPATIKSAAWKRELKKINPKAKVFSASCPLFVPLVEEGLANHQVAKIMAKKYLKSLLSRKIDTLILACTHYPLLEETIKGVAKKVLLINPGKTTALFLKRLLESNELRGKTRKPKHQFFFTDLSYQAIANLEKFSGKVKRGRIEEISLRKL